MITDLLIDPEDEHYLTEHSWTLLQTHGLTYATAKGGLLLHRLIMNAPSGVQVDHRNGNGLDNRRSNLRIATNQQNHHNTKAHRDGTSRFKGVHWESGREKWQAQITTPGGKHKTLGRFTVEEDAARAYDRAAREAFGEFARCNFEEAAA